MVTCMLGTQLIQFNTVLDSSNHLKIKYNTQVNGRMESNKDTVWKPGRTEENMTEALMKVQNMGQASNSGQMELPIPENSKTT